MVELDLSNVCHTVQASTGHDACFAKGDKERLAPR
jgi:hypothetical protein